MNYRRTCRWLLVTLGVTGLIKCGGLESRVAKLAPAEQRNIYVYFQQYKNLTIPLGYAAQTQDQAVHNFSGWDKTESYTMGKLAIAEADYNTAKANTLKALQEKFPDYKFIVVSPDEYEGRKGKVIEFDIYPVSKNKGQNGLRVSSYMDITVKQTGTFQNLEHTCHHYAKIERDDPTTYENYSFAEAKVMPIQFIQKMPEEAIYCFGKFLKDAEIAPK